MKRLYRFTEIGFDEEMSYSDKQRTVVLNYLNLVMFCFSLVRCIYVAAEPVVNYAAFVKLMNALPIAVSLLFVILLFLKKQRLVLVAGILILPPMVVAVSYYTHDTAVQLILLILPVLIFFFLNNFQYILLSFLYVAFWFASLFVIQNNIFHEALHNSVDKPLTIINCTGALSILFFTLYAVKYQVWSFEKYILKKNQELRTLNNVKDKIFTIVSHDLQAPLIGVDRLFNYFLQNGGNIDELKKMLPEIASEIKNTLNIFTNLLNWSKTQLKQVKVTPANINLQQQTCEMMAEVKTAADVKQIKLLNEVEYNSTAYADAEMFRIVLRNLVMNAIKYSYPNSIVTVYSRQEGDKIIIGVTDEGKGISASVQQSLLSVFDHTTAGTNDEKGYGLGLMICKELAELNNGSLHFNSEEGKGSDFRVELPCATTSLTLRKMQTRSLNKHDFSIPVTHFL
jgi:signal transduction histidine kinase